MGFLRPSGSRSLVFLTSLIGFLLLFGLIGCDETGPVDPEPIDNVLVTEDLIDSVNVPEFWVLGSEEFRQVTFSFALTQEQKDAINYGDYSPAVVWVSIRDQDGSEVAGFMIRDDGGALPDVLHPGFVHANSGDLVPNDFIFSNQINAGFTTIEGVYTFEVSVWGMIPPGMSAPDVIPPPIVVVSVTVSANEAPVFGEVSLPDNLNAGFDVQQWTLEVTDPDEEVSEDEVVEVMVELLANDISYREFLFAQLNSSTWIFTADSTFAAGLLTADYTMSVTATDKFNQVSEPLEHAVWIENLAPELMSLSAPDTTQQPGPDDPPNVYTFTLDVTDSQGQGDIESVYYTVLDPTGGFSTHPDYVFRDDGEDGDEIAGDGTWTHLFQVPREVSNFGTYTFTFYATDRAGQDSDPIEHELVLIVSSEPHS
ncbi:MAG TPA: hypothetical protein ENH10_05450 [Bacteroidetes bacterium]|nr:hypothetical protein BMS3Bbin04_00257 [bacterium BMS3Bbin04]HDO65464.1 hypothetical protein [Bacteroidota bacterium]HEX04589.1 hypothetical protein [Bacteroidota bacterium]